MMDGDAAAADEDLDRVGEGQDLRRHPGIIRQDRVAVRVELHERGLGDVRGNAPIRPGVDPRQGPQLLLPEHLGRRPPRRPMDPEVSLLLPDQDFGVELLQARDGSDPEERFGVADDPLDPALLVGFPNVEDVDRKSIMPGEVHKRRGVPDGGIALHNDEAQVVIAMAMGDSSDLVERPDVAVQEKLQALAGIEPEEVIARPGQDIDEPVDRARLDLPHHPVHLRLFPWNEGQLEETPGGAFCETPSSPA